MSVTVEYVDDEKAEYYRYIHERIVKELSGKIPEIVKMTYWVAEMNKTHGGEHIAGFFFYADPDVEPFKLMIAMDITVDRNIPYMALEDRSGKLLGFVLISYLKCFGRREFDAGIKALKKALGGT